MSSFRSTIILVFAVFWGLYPWSVAASSYQVNKLVDNASGMNMNTDPNLINSWGFFFTPNGDFWVADNGTNLSTLYKSNGTLLNFVINVPGNPTGMVRNPCKDAFLIGPLTSPIHLPSSFLFATESGTILGFNQNVDLNNAIIAVNNAQRNAVYKGLEIVKNCCSGGCCGELFLFATDFHNAQIDLFKSDFTYLHSITNYAIPAGYAPFNVRKLDCLVYVTYAKQLAPDNHDDEAGSGHGFVDVFTETGMHVKRLISHGALNSPWGLAIAPESFGQFGGALLVGNFGDGFINAYDRCTGEHLGHLMHATGTPIQIDGLWSLDFDNRGRLYFTSGPQKEAGGLVGFISVVP